MMQKQEETVKNLKTPILILLFPPGVVSVSVHPNYNGGIAHALFYGLTKREKLLKRNISMVR